MMRRSIATQKIMTKKNVNKNTIHCSKVIFEVIFSVIAILSLGSNIFLMSMNKTVSLRGIHVKYCTATCNISSTATGREIRLNAKHGVRH